jgi:hypothetical protein
MSWAASPSIATSQAQNFLKFEKDLSFIPVEWKKLEIL